MALWAQVHSSVVIAPAVAIAASLPWFWPTERRRGWAPLSVAHLVTLGLTAILPLTGPSGLDLIRRVLAHQDNYLIRRIAEMKPLSLDLWLSAEPDIVLVKILLLVALLGLLRHPRFQPGPILLGLLGAYLALGKNRFAAAWCILLIPLVAGAVCQAKQGAEGWRRRAAAVAAVLGVVALLSWGSDVPSFETSPQFEPGPPQAVTALQLQGTLFNTYDQGGYLGWKLYGRPKVIIDSRSQMRFHLEEIFSALHALRNGAVFRALNRVHGFSAALVPPDVPLCQDLASIRRGARSGDPPGRPSSFRKQNT